MDNKKRNTIIAIAAATVIAGVGVFMATRGDDDAVQTDAPVSEASSSLVEESSADISEDPSSADEFAEDSSESAEADTSIVPLDPETTDTDSSVPAADTPAYVETDSEIIEHLAKLEAAKQNTPVGEGSEILDPEDDWTVGWEDLAEQVGKHPGLDGFFYSDEPGGPSTDSEGHYKGHWGSWVPELEFTNDMGGDLSGYPQVYIDDRRGSDNADPYFAYAVSFDTKFYEMFGIQISSFELNGWSDVSNGSDEDFLDNFCSLVGERFSLPLHRVGDGMECDGLGGSVPDEATWNAWINGRKASEIPLSEIAAHYKWMNEEYDQGEEINHIFYAVFMLRRF